jgi:integrase
MNGALAKLKLNFRCSRSTNLSMVNGELSLQGSDRFHQFPIMRLRQRPRRHPLNPTGRPQQQHAGAAFIDEPFFATRRVAEVTSDLVAKYVDQRQLEKAQNATINREMAALKRMFRIGMYSTSPKVLRLPKFPKLAGDNVRKGFLEDAQYKKLIGYCPDVWFRSLVEMGRTYGWRISELINLKVKQVDINARIIRLEPGTTKNKDGREVTMTTAVHALLVHCVEGKSADEAVFTRSDGVPVKDFRDMWAKATEAAGVPGLLFHDLRRTAARNLRRAGIAEGVIMKIGGWRTRSVFERYAIVSQTDIADALRKLEAS